MKVKSIIFLSLLIGLSFIASFQSTSVISFQIKTEKEDFQIKTNALEESWDLTFDHFGLELVIDSNNCIYVMSSENYHCAFGCRHYGDIIIVKYNSSGDQLWRVDLEGLIVEYSKIAVDTKNNLYLSSMYKNRTITDNMILYKFNSSGDIQWQQTWESGNNGNIVDIDIDSENNIYIYGRSDSTEEFRFDLFIVKYDSSGDQKWIHIYEKIDEYQRAFDIEIDSDDNILISGHTSWHKNESIYGYYWLMCYNQSGEIKWNITSDEFNFYVLAVDSSDNMISFRKSSIVKYNNLGNLLWEWKSNVNFGWVPHIAFDSFDDIYVATTISIPEDHHTTDLYMFKLNSSGNFEWYLTWGGSDDEYLRTISIDLNNNIYSLSDHVLIKNPENNGKSLTNEKLWNFYMIVFIICFSISGITLYLIIRRKIPKVLRNET